MKELLEKRGWRMFYQCNCGGSLRLHFQNKDFPHYEIRIRPTRFTFTIIGEGMMIAGPKHANELEPKMKVLELW